MHPRHSADCALFEDLSMVIVPEGHEPSPPVIPLQHFVAMPAAWETKREHLRNGSDTNLVVLPDYFANVDGRNRRAGDVDQARCAPMQRDVAAVSQSVNRFDVELR
jgi:hypothetical protein